MLVGVNLQQLRGNMPQTQNRAVMIWLLIFAGLVAFMVVFGGFVRLTRSGLSIVEWHPIGGVIPPLTQADWGEAFAKYQQTPEYIQLNYWMTLEDYKYIFYIEWWHRLLARLVGLVYAIPFFWFLWHKKIPGKEVGMYVAIGVLFLLQAFMGWYMVASGLVDRPAVSHYRLTMHLMLAIALLGLSLWIAYGHRYGFPDRSRPTRWSFSSKMAAVALVILLIQIAYGGLVAGLKAGHVSNTWPLMLGQWIPGGIFGAQGFDLLNLVETPQTVAFIHRWFAFLGILVVPHLYWQARKRGYPVEIQRGLLGLLGLVVIQIVLGIHVVLLNVPILLALLHQAGAIALFWLSVFFLHRLRAIDQTA